MNTIHDIQRAMTTGKNDQSSCPPLFEAGTGKVVIDILQLTRAFLHGTASSFSLLIGINALVNPPFSPTFLAVGLACGVIGLSTEIVEKLEKTPSVSIIAQKIAPYCQLTNSALNYLGHFGQTWNTFLLILNQIPLKEDDRISMVQILSYCLFIPISIFAGLMSYFTRSKMDRFHIDPFESGDLTKGEQIGGMIRGLIAPTFLLNWLQHTKVLPPGNKLTQAALSISFITAPLLSMTSCFGASKDYPILTKNALFFLEMCFENLSSAAALLLLPATVLEKTPISHTLSSIVPASYFFSVLFFITLDILSFAKYIYVPVEMADEKNTSLLDA